MPEVGEGLSMMAVDISKVLRAALIRMGVPSTHIDTFTQHATIELTFKDVAPLWITVEHHKVWVWATLTALNETNIGVHAKALIDVVQHPLPGVLTGQVVIGKQGNAYVIKGLLADECTTSIDYITSMLEGFYALLKLINVAFKH